MAASGVFLALDYIAGFFVFGLFYGVINLILPNINSLTPGTPIYVWCQYAWNGALVAYIGLGILFLYSRLKEYDVVRRM
jgi:branched-subunit amino acid permease